MTLPETDILVDILRSYKPALTWISQVEDSIAISGFTAMELVQGCRTSKELEKILNIIRKFNILWFSEEGCNKAFSLFSKYIWLIKSDLLTQ